MKKPSRPTRFVGRLAMGATAVALLVTGFAGSGCSSAAKPTLPVFGATPIFSAGERYARIGRNWNLETKMLNEDLDRALLLRPTSSLTEYNLP